MKRASKSILPKILLDRKSAVPLYRQFYQAVAHAIRNGTLNSGNRLPSSRMMARLLGVSRNTVLSAYEELAAEELITGRVGSGTQVQGGQVVQGRGIVDCRDWRRESRFPARIIAFTDADGNLIYLNY